MSEIALERQAIRVACAAAALALLTGTVLAAEPACESRYTSVQHEVAKAGLSTDKEVQVKALLEQVARACKENKEVVAMAGLDQVQAILADQSKTMNGSSSPGSLR